MPADRPTDFAATRAFFDLPPGMIYLDGNSLGPLPRTAAARVAQTVTDEWGRMVITGWNRAGWIGMPSRIGDRIGRLIGAEPGSVVMGDTLSIKVYQALAAALELSAGEGHTPPTASEESGGFHTPRTPGGIFEKGRSSGRRVILSDTGNFPSDLYMAEGLCRTLGDDYSLRTVAPEDLIGAVDESVAVVLATEVDYRTGRRHDMAALTARAHAHGALAVWDLAHSAGALPVDVAGGGADFAVGCTYKYLNSGPGGPAFIYVAPRHADLAVPALSGWLGHAAPFAFDPAYRPARGVERMRVGTPPILQLAALDAALDVWDMADIHDVRARALDLGDRFIAGVEAACPDLVLATPRAHAERGSQVSFRHPQGYAVMQALIARGVIGDFRAPDILRFGLTPLYIGEAEIDAAVAILAEVMATRAWDRPEHHARAAVT